MGICFAIFDILVYVSLSICELQTEYRYTQPYQNQTHAIFSHTMEWFSSLELSPPLGFGCRDLEEVNPMPVFTLVYVYVYMYFEVKL